MENSVGRETSQETVVTIQGTEWWLRPGCHGGKRETQSDSGSEEDRGDRTCCRKEKTQR